MEPGKEPPWLSGKNIPTVRLFVPFSSVCFRLGIGFIATTSLQERLSVTHLHPIEQTQLFVLIITICHIPAFSGRR